MATIAHVLTQKPVIAVVCGSGQVTSAALAAQADLILVLNSGYYRSMAGVGSLASMMPYGNANDQTLELLKTVVLPRSPTLPVVAGVLANDPTVDLSERLETLKKLGVQGITNWPSLGLLNGHARAQVEDGELTIEHEAAALKQAREMGFYTFGFVLNADDAAVMADSGVNALIISPGISRQLEDIFQRRDQIQHAIGMINAVLARVRKRRPKMPCLAFGGPITTPEDLEQLFLHSAIDGFAGGSAFDRIPVENILTSTIRRFKGAAAGAGEDKRDESMGALLGRSPKMLELFRVVRRVAPFDVNVCVEGESGTGKELIATQIHRLSPRSQQAFVTLNCGAIPDALLESELFGHEKGAFTGADRRRLGKFELAHRGTLFLDEIADLTPRGQVALLRAIQQREITRVGGDAYIPVDVRIVTASNQPLEKLVADGRFRSDLYHRINHITLQAPPLRERTDDLGVLAEDILRRLQNQLGRKLHGLSESFHSKLRRHAWAGNVRELQHVLTRAALLEEGEVLEGIHFSPVVHAASGLDLPEGAIGPLADVKRDACRVAVAKALQESNGNKSQAAASLGVSRKTLYAWLKEMDLEQ